MCLAASRENSLYFGLAVASLLCDYLLLHFGDKLFDLKELCLGVFMHFSDLTKLFSH